MSRDQAILQYLPSLAPEYLYVSGIAVLKIFRRKKIATVVQKACDALSVKWGLEYLAVRAYEDDFGARQWYSYAIPSCLQRSCMAEYLDWTETPCSGGETLY
ncbi:unnamed protein product [Malus baccata var. baccata]